MARIRTIKPEFPQSETMGRLSRDARLLFIQLWTLVDDEGRARAPSRMLASLLYPYDDDARELMEGWLAELDEHGCIRRYTVDGSQYLDIPNWLKHQKIDKASKSRLPAFDETSRIVENPREESATDLGPRTSTGTKDQEGAASAPPPPKASKKDRKRATALPDGFEPDWSAATSAGLSRTEAERELQKFKNYAAQNGRACIDWQAAWRNWCLKAAEYLKKPLQPETTAAPMITPHSPSWNVWKTHYRDTGQNARAAMMDRFAAEGKPFTVPSDIPPARKLLAQTG